MTARFKKVKLYKCFHCKERKRTAINHKSCSDTSCLAKEAIRQLCLKKAKEKKKNKKLIDSWRPTAKSQSYKSKFQIEINKCARLIDAYFGYTDCICCKRKLDKKINGAHYHGVQANPSIRYNLHNIHSSTEFCNFYSANHKSGYEKGLEKRYFELYKNMVLKLPIEYKEIHVSGIEIFEKLKLIRKINRNIEMFMLNNSVATRDFINQEIGIYK